MACTQFAHKKSGFCRFFLFVEKMDRKGKVGGECRPNKIGDLQIGGRARNAGVFPHIRGDQNEQEQNPKGGKKEQPQAEEKDRVEEIDDKACAIEGEPVSCRDGISFSFEVNDGGGDAHQGVKDAPSNREDDGGRRERGHGDGVVKIHAAARKPCGKTADGKRDQDADEIRLDFLEERHVCSFRLCF